MFSRCCILCICRISSGSNFQALQLFLADQSYQHCLQTLQYTGQLTSTLKLLIRSKEFITNLCGSPSNDLLMEFFLKTSAQYTALHEQRMSQLTGTILSCDHTFKVSKNIGFARPGDNKWQNLFDSLFCIMNEDGLVIAFKLTSQRSFQVVEPLMTELRSRHKDKKLQIIIDNCCSWRKQLQGIFGGDTDVKLDLFHAIQRVTKTVSRRHPLNKQFVHGVRCVFRMATDHGVKRQQPTPTSAQISRQMRLFRDNWKEASSTEGVSLLTGETSKALDNLMKHVQQGCLAEIPIGAGTNRNERLHKLLNNSSLNVPRLGPEMAISLLHCVFYDWNSRKMEPGKPILPIWINTDQPCPATRSSILSSEISVNPQPMQMPHHDSQAEPYRRNDAERSVSKTAADDQALQAQSARAETLDCQDTPENQSTIHISNDVAASLHTRAHKMTQVFHFLKKTHPRFLINETQFSNAVFNASAILKKWTTSAQSVLENKTVQTMECMGLTETFTSTGSSNPEIMTKLHAIVCTEHTTGDIVTATVTELVQAVNAADVIVVILGPCQQDTRAILLPETDISKTVSFSYAAVSRGHDGTYKTLNLTSAVSQPSTPATLISQPDAPSEPPKGCRCGERLTEKMSAGSHRACATLPGQYPSRCPCLKSLLGCTHACICRECSNPYGIRNFIVSGTQVRGSRKQTSRTSFRRLRGEKFVASLGEKHSIGWTHAEAFTLGCVGQHLQIHFRVPSSNNLQHLFNKVADICQSGCDQISIHPKSNNQINSKYKHLQKLKTNMEHHHKLFSNM